MIEAELCLLAERCVLFATGELVLPMLRGQLRVFLTSCVDRPDLREEEYTTVHMASESDIFGCIKEAPMIFLDSLVHVLSWNHGKANIYFTFIFKIFWHYGCFWVV